jgi:cobalt/nickel transport system permease protein
MHMADALLSPAVGAAMWGVSAAALGWSARRVRARSDDRLVPLMGVLGAFVFAAQMINVAIPGTGCSGHLVGGWLLAALLGPPAALLVMASVLAVQALFFADGGLLAFGANVFNLGVVPCLIVYPLVYAPLAGRRHARARVIAAALVAGIAAAVLGALGVVAQTAASGVTALPAAHLAWLLLPVQTLAGIGEGLAAAALLLFIARHRPDLLAPLGATRRPLRPVLAATTAAALLAGGVVSGFASNAPDGLEWLVARVAGPAGVASPEGALHQGLGALQARLSVPAQAGAAPADDASTGLVGVALTLGLVSALGWWLGRRRALRRRPAS